MKETKLIKPLNNKIWTNLSVKEIEKSNYQASCCLNVVVNQGPKQG